MRKNWLAIAALACLSYAHADRIPDNLRGFTLDDICFYLSSAIIDDKPLENLAKKLTQTIMDQDELYGIGLSKIRNPMLCKQAFFFTVEGFKSSTGAYVYTYSLILFANESAIKKGAIEIPVKDVVIYDVGGYGLSPNEASFLKTIEESAKTSFQTLALDWRKTH